MMRNLTLVNLVPDSTDLPNVNQKQGVHNPTQQNSYQSGLIIAHTLEQQLIRNLSKDANKTLH